jgi:ubiquinone/menaquinone biosynthesis C-methylase UbiE
MVKSFKDYEHEGWNSKASQYERAALPLSSQGFEPILKSFGNLKGKKFLDVCTGPGHLAAEAAARGASVDAIDFSEAMVGEAKARFSGIGFMEGDAEALPYDDVSFDAVACCFGLLHLPNPTQGVRESYRVLKPGGRYSVTLWNGPERGGEFFKVILQTVSTLADMHVDLPEAPPMFELSEPGKIESLMGDAGFANTQRMPIAWYGGPGVPKTSWNSSMQVSGPLWLSSSRSRKSASGSWKNWSKRSDRMRGVQGSK